MFVLRHWPLWGESAGDRWIPLSKDQWRWKCFHLGTSSCLRDIGKINWHKTTSTHKARTVCTSFKNYKPLIERVTYAVLRPVLLQLSFRKIQGSTSDDVHLPAAKSQTTNSNHSSHKSVHDNPRNMSGKGLVVMVGNWVGNFITDNFEDRVNFQKQHTYFMCCCALLWFGTGRFYPYNFFHINTPGLYITVTS